MATPNPYKVNNINQGATINPQEVSPYYPYGDNPLYESNILAYLIRAEEAAKDAEAALEAAEAAQKAAEEAQKAAEEAQAAAEEAQLAVEALFKAYPVGEALIYNDQQTPADLILTIGNPALLDATVSEAYMINFLVQRSVDLDYRLDAYQVVFMYVNGTWFAQQIDKAVSTTDTDVYFSITTNGTLGQIQYTSSLMVGGAYTSLAKYKGLTFAI